MIPELPATMSAEILLKENAELRMRVACLEERCRELEEGSYWITDCSQIEPG
ncbi:hypothetical protein [Endozoicomonas sp. SCSIO W0465]|uniref:hypothetical protein n=1 Tax=Endozoicomonas sp. SCSIO W0465 TaxID=2918516 RepID=UPI002075C408|nr:hypothetical protein [Endozoicomonas sp. SCSIO W0465]USE39151.1 hypothetical protein MJO57_13925 [Endozoicomonas sp. SCSIO W0465]